MLEYLSSRFVRGVSIPEIAKDLGISGAAVHAWQKKKGLPKRRQKLRSKEWLQLHYKTKNLAEIASELGVTYQAVGHYLHKFNIPRKSRSEIQKIATKKYRSESENLFPKTDLVSRGYCIRHNGYWFASAGEFSYYLYLLNQNIPFKFQPFTFNHKRPDFLLLNENKVVEIKVDPRFKGNTVENDYYTWAKEMKEELGHEYEIIDVKKFIPDLYQKVIVYLRKNKARRGITISISSLHLSVLDFENEFHKRQGNQI